MELTERALIQAAAAVARLRRHGDRHTVAAAVLSPDGRVFTGVDVRRGGGPAGIAGAERAAGSAADVGGACAEVVAVGTAATQGVRELRTIVTVGDRGRQVREPCADCRRLLAELFPDLRIILGTPEEPYVMTVAELSVRQP
ncbi:cytidine deaminase [Plantactinospora sp. KBS50]|uniref:cytidine deaminase family protein n=1 Tax=Plantactinospora sp. KBS50 TaxID=2024580 RepID=UPI000BAAFE37|nr:cytidine deaminase [Plantactinospora sp. KBS50]ASW54519.1 hypothetical protein CIK06_10460 [Plantactinospora sp. KBS50]